MCILQDSDNGKELFESLQQNVQDVQALVLIHNGKANYNLTGKLFACYEWNGFLNNFFFILIFSVFVGSVAA